MFLIMIIIFFYKNHKDIVFVQYVYSDETT